MPHVELRVRARYLIVAAALSLLPALLLPDRVWTIVFVSLSGLVLVSYLWARALAAGLSAERNLRFRWHAVGDFLEEQFALHNSSGLPALWVEIQDQSNVPGYRARGVRSAGSRQTTRWREQAVCSRRGRFQIGPWALRSGDPFGLFEVEVFYPQHDDIVIHPPIHAQIPLTLPAGLGQGTLRQQQRAWQALTNVSSVRDYRSGDPYKMIHWPSVARRADLIVRQFERDSGGDIWLLLDMQRSVQLGSGLAGTEEHAVLLAASLVHQSLEARRAIGLATYGQQPLVTPPQHGEGQRWRLLRQLALATADGEIPLQHALDDLRRQMRSGSALLILTASHDVDWLPAIGALMRQRVAVSVALFDRASFGGTGSGDRLQQTIRQLGAACTLLGQGDIGRPVDNERPASNWEFVVTPMGKAIVRRRPQSR